MPTCQAMVLDAVGAANKFRQALVSVPAPGPHEVVVEHTAIGVNYIDVYYRNGTYALPQVPCILGMEAAGVVRELGSGVSSLHVGDRVGYVLKTPGAYCQQRVCPADRLVPLPQQIDDMSAAGVLLKGLTAYYLVHKTFAVHAGTQLLIHAAAGGVGSLLTQWAKYLGAFVIGTVGSAEKVSLARRQGCDAVIVHREEDVVARVRELTDGRGVDVVYDAIGQATFAQSLDCLRPFGLMVSYGQASGSVQPFDIAQLGAKGALYLTRPTLFLHIADSATLRSYATALFDAMERGIIRLDPPTTFPLVDVARAHDALESRTTTGSLVLLP